VVAGYLLIAAAVWWGRRRRRAALRPAAVRERSPSALAGT
jgi:hypothetical protein